ncbi:MAG TPA: hypothetical protein VIA29_08250 [Thermoanaerobaculia bacterium]
MRSNSADGFLDLEAGIPTTPEDVRVLRELRARRLSDPLVEVNRLAAPSIWPRSEPAPVRTFEGHAPFELS